MQQAREVLAFSLVNTVSTKQKKNKEKRKKSFSFPTVLAQLNVYSPPVQLLTVKCKLGDNTQ